MFGFVVSSPEEYQCPHYLGTPASDAKEVRVVEQNRTLLARALRVIYDVVVIVVIVVIVVVVGGRGR